MTLNWTLQRIIDCSCMKQGVLEEPLGLRANEILLFHAVGDWIHGNNFNKFKVSKCRLIFTSTYMKAGLK